MEQRFEIQILLGNDAAQTPADVAAMLRKLADKLEDREAFADGDCGTLRDADGNSVGEWGYEEAE